MNGLSLRLVALLLVLGAIGAWGADFEREGIASWYGGKFHGRLTANGERFDANKLTAAHKTLPFGTVVKVTNTDNGKTVTVRINDRGPFVENRIIDLSRGAAERVEMTGTGVARVQLEIIHPGEVDPGTRVIQIGSFSMPDNADAVATRLTDAGFDPQIEEADGGIYRVTLIDVPEEELEDYRNRLSRLGYSHVLVRRR
ncbi:MAG: septal ring lytic transglycosylase RlpA family protein [Spirochaetes bacterium]|jgi:rare lipoprotein A|nr:septal ring lytic transglycosylase RlpA family protein [Spirochaetota bacterium]